MSSDRIFKMNPLTALTFMLVAAYVTAQAPCSSKDSGPFLGTKPTLNIDLPEATAAQLSSNPDQYRAELRLNGVVGGQGSDGIVLEVMPDYSFMNPEDSFRFTEQNGVNYVQMYKPVDRDGPTSAVDDDINVIGFTLKCSPSSNTSDATLYDTRIVVEDINDNAPVFLNMTSDLIINELTPVGQTVLTVRADDIDLLSNLTYMLQTRQDLADDMSSYFELNPTTGELKVKAGLDYETMSEGSLVIAVQDGGSPPMTATTTLAVTVEDGNDQGPVYVYPGCWTYRARCAWPKFTTSTSITQGQPISVLPVPNKVQAEVAIKAKDLDHSANPISFSIASTIPPGSENLFTVTTAMTGRGEYAATITPTTTTKLSHGFEIFLQAEEQSDQKRFEIAMIFFEDPNHMCASGNAAGQTQSQTQTGSDSNTANTASDDDKYTEPVIALIVVVAILAAFVLCLSIAFFCVLRRSSSSTGGDVALNASSQNGHAAF